MADLMRDMFGGDTNGDQGKNDNRVAFTASSNMNKE
jgi:hypothetical protein